MKLLVLIIKTKTVILGILLFLRTTEKNESKKIGSCKGADKAVIHKGDKNTNFQLVTLEQSSNVYKRDGVI